MTVKEAASILNGIVEAGHGEAELFICLDHGDENRDEQYDLGIDKINITNACGDLFVSLESYLFHDCVIDLVKRFGYKGVIEE